MKPLSRKVFHRVGVFYRFWRNSMSNGLLFKLSHHPLIYRFAYYGDREDAFLFLYPLSFKYRQEPLYYLCNFGCYFSDYVKKRFVKSFRRFRRLFNNHNIIFLCNTIQDTKDLIDSGYMAIYCNQNCFIDEKIYYPLGIKKTLDAVYDARISEVKRHELCKELDSLGLISYMHPSTHNAVYVAHIDFLLAHAHRFNKRNSTDVYLDNNQVNKAINSCRVGLCLSAKEGAMNASIQYLLAGLPVVTTYNVGGRDAFFKPDYVSWVNPEPYAIKSAVYELIDKNLNGDFIRENTIELVWEHRFRFFELVDRICDWHGAPHFIREDWDLMFTNRLYHQAVNTKEVDKRYYRLRI